MRHAVILASLATLLSFGAIPAHADKRVALIVGNSDYRQVTPLRNPRNDALDVAGALRKIGFEVMPFLDLNKEMMEQATLEFGRAALTADVALVYYTGHAMEFKGENYLIPVEAKLKGESDLDALFKVDSLKAVMQQSGGVRILILDACRDNPFADELKRSLAGSSLVRGTSIQRGLARIDDDNGGDMIVMFATGANQTAADGTGRNSPFTAAFLKNFVTPNNFILNLSRVQAAVARETRNKQKPLLSIQVTDHTMQRYSGVLYASLTSPIAPVPANTCSRADADFAYNEATRIRTMQAFREFLEKCPDDPRQARIQDFIRQVADEEAWERAAKENTIKAYVEYIALFPTGRYLEEAKKKERDLRQPPPPALPSVAPVVTPPPPPSVMTPPPPPPRAEFTYYRGTDFNGDDLNPADPFMLGYTLETCADACRSRSGCRAFTFNTKKDACILKRGFGRSLSDSNAISAAIITDPGRPDQPAATAASEPDFRYQHGVDFIGDDLNPSNPYLRGHSLASCAGLCRATGGCRAFTFNTEKNVCILKSGTGSPKREPIAISASLAPGYRQSATRAASVRIDIKHDVDYAGGDLYDRRYISLEQCQSLCGTSGQCVAFSYVETKSWCWLKKELTTPRRKVGVISGAKPD